MRIFNLLKSKSIVTILLICNFSCKNTEKNDKQVAYEGQLENGKPVGVWTYFDINKKIIKQLFYYPSKLQTLSYDAKYYSSERMIFMEKVRNDSLLLTVSPENPFFGKTIFDEYCSHCHFLNENSIAISMSSILKKNTMDEFNKKVLNHEKEKFDYLPKSDINLIYSYIKDNLVRP